jgi:uncharacterized membrane protein YqgA involved in biofilm formation
MLGTVVNSSMVIGGGILGAIIGNSIKAKYKDTIMQGISLSVVVIGFSMALKGLSLERPGGLPGEMLLLMIFSLVIGGIIGEAVDIEERLDSFGKWIQGIIYKTGGAGSFSKGFVMASLVYCVGSMAIIGSIEDGLQHNPNTLYAKSVLDGVSAVVFASELGFGVALSAVPVFIYQGAITLLASYLKPILTDWVITSMSAVGGVLIIGIGFTMLDIKKIKVGNLLPSIFIPLVYGIIIMLVEG